MCPVGASKGEGKGGGGDVRCEKLCCIPLKWTSQSDFGVAGSALCTLQTELLTVNGKQDTNLMKHFGRKFHGEGGAFSFVYGNIQR